MELLGANVDEHTLFMINAMRLHAQGLGLAPSVQGEFTDNRPTVTR